jgi:hypothetical protein
MSINEAQADFNLFQKDMINRFTSHPVTEEETAKALDTIRLQCLRLSSYIGQYVPKGRERSTALTKLEEVMFWANAGIARSNKEVT